MSKPPKMTFAIGLCISLPGKSPRKASGINANADDKAVIRIGFKRSSEPWTMHSRKPMPCSSRNKL